jgi:sulfonate dioxygenase
MATSAVEVQTATVPDVATLKLEATLSGPYKELAAKYDPDAEAGLKSHKAAKVNILIVNNLKMEY